ncbi:CRTAC1 family protein [Candidatus Poribacteria bacterium]|nr:CRTAC1 family protein [Candidatus Poribacteria bacterium]MYA99652.1 CRTAC1 family protein [Candidatus Poribacteria bacterium]
MKRRNSPINIFIHLLIVILCGATVSPANADTGIQFVDVTQEAGIHWKHTDGRSGQKYFMETLGSGAAFFDYDADGDPDLYFVNGAPLPGYVADDIPTNCLYRNNGDGTFTDVTENAGVGDTGYGHGCAVGDYNNDGQLDLYITNYGTNRLYRNNGDGTFTDVAEVAGVTEPRWSSSCAFADYDRDGNLDLYVVNYIVFDIDENPWCGLKEKGIRAYCEPDNFLAQSDTLFRNNGDGTFTDVTKSAGIYNTTGKGLGVVWGDYNNDGALDIYVANDSTENFFYHNNSDGTFEEVGFMIGVALSENGAAENGMGTAFGDWNNDGWFDLTVTNYAQQTNTLYHNDADGFFTDATATTKTAQLTYPYLGWATAFIDYDNDGYQDLFVANGHLHENLAELGQQGTYGQRNLLFRNNYNGTFTEVSETLGPGMKLEDVSRGATFADYDSDGDIDIVVTNSNATPRLLRNDGGNRKNYLQIRLVATQGSIDAIGARVKIKTGELTQTREVRSGDGYLSQRDLTRHFGIGDYKQVDSIEIQWQSGVKQLIKSVPANQVLSLEENRDE